jgi:hypothetical protein
MTRIPGSRLPFTRAARDAPKPLLEAPLFDLRWGIQAEPISEHDHLRIRDRCMRRSYIFERLMSMRDAYTLPGWSPRPPNIILVHLRLR